MEEIQHSGKMVKCFIPKINGIPVLGNGYIIAESINNEGVVKNNIEVAEFFLNKKKKEIQKFFDENSKFLDLT